MRSIATKNTFLLVIVLLLILTSAIFVGCHVDAKDDTPPDIASEIKDDPSGGQREGDDGQLLSNESNFEAVSKTGDGPDDEPGAGGNEQLVDEPNSETPLDSEDNSDDEPLGSESGQIRREIRAIWSWEGVKATSKDDIDELVTKVDAAHLNVIFLLVYAKGTAFFEPSHRRFPDSNERLANQSAFSEEGFSDALQYLVAIRDERRADDNLFNDFEVHAWFNVNQGGDQEQGWPRIDKTEPYMLHALFPEFRTKLGAYYSKPNERFIAYMFSVFQQPKFRAYMADLMAGLVEDYNVDGIHLDHIRAGEICFNDEPLDYPGTEYDYPGCQEDYKAWAEETYGREYTLWEDTDGFREIRDGGSGRVAAWQERAVGTLVKETRDGVKSVNPNAVISVAALVRTVTEDRRASYEGQVAWEWLDKAWIDAVFPMAYTPDAQQVVDRVQLFRDAAEKDESRSKIFPGLITYWPPNSGKDYWSYLIVEQVNAVMHEQWTGQPLEPPANGVAFYLDRRLSQEAIEALADGPFKEPALPYWGE